jgi:hypothetical protein
VKFLISMSDVEDEWETLPAAEQERIMGRHDELIRELGDRYVCCYGMRASREAKTVRMHADGKLTVTDGLATPTKEPLGGFYVIEAASMAEAVEWAKKGRFRPGPNEVREIREG